ncbi:hypothetical protein FE275_01105 [Pseudomonas koreensis]|nr:hypothetical protein FE275_01105 [Pseudomonas koreensis]
MSLFFTWEKRFSGFLRARTLSQKTALSERICRLVFWLYAVYTIGQCLPILILPKDDKKTGESTTVGASLLAKALDQPTLMLNLPTHSRAGSLPHGLCCVVRFFLY